MSKAKKPWVKSEHPWNVNRATGSTGPRKITKLVIIASLASVSAVCQTQQRGSNVTAEGKRFLIEAAAQARKQSEIARLALQKGSDDAVRRFAQQLLTDATRAADQFEKLAASKNALNTADGRDTSSRPTIPAGKSTTESTLERSEPQTSSGSNASAVREVRGAKQLSAGGVSTDRSLAETSAAEFDSEFLREVIADDQMTITQFESAQRTLSDPDVKMLVSAVLPTVQQQLQMARRLASK